MGYAIEIENSNNSLGAPQGMEHEVYALKTILGLDQPENKICNVSKWEFTDEEAEKILDNYKQTGKLHCYLTVWGGHPPARIEGQLPESVIPKTLGEIKEMIQKGEIRV